MIAIAMLSLAGLPPLRASRQVLVFKNVLEAGYTLRRRGLVASYLGLYFYLRVIQYMFMAEHEHGRRGAAAPRGDRERAVPRAASCSCSSRLLIDRL